MQETMLIIVTFITNLMIFTGVPRVQFRPEVPGETQPCKRTRVSSTRAVCCIDSYRWTRYQMERWRLFKPRRAARLARTPNKFSGVPRRVDRRLYIMIVTDIKPNRPRLQLLSSRQQFCRCLFWWKCFLGLQRSFSPQHRERRPPEAWSDCVSRLESDTGTLKGSPHCLTFSRALCDTSLKKFRWTHKLTASPLLPSARFAFTASLCRSPSVLHRFIIITWNAGVATNSPSVSCFIFRRYK